MAGKFRMDAARWASPRKSIDPSTVSTGKILKMLWRYLALQAVMLFRFGSWCKQHHIPFAGITQRLIYLIYGLEISVSADIGGGLYIAHPIGTVIAPQKMGENCTIVGSVTIGMRNEWKFPRIGNNVFIGAGARVLGDIEIGDGANIGANAVVIKDVPAGATMVGIPARIVRMNGKPVPSPAEPEPENEEELLDVILS